jgi:integrase
VAWLRREAPPNKLRKEDLITDEEFRKMLNSTDSLIHKAILCVLYEGGPRPGELRSMKLKDVIVNDNFIKIYVAGKMAKKQGKRPVYVIKHYDIVKAWIENHPMKDNEDAYVWIIKGKKPITHSTLKKMISELGKKAGLNKKVFPYIFRHTVGTRLYGKYGSVYARRLMGHVAGSKMEQVYCHLSEEDVENVILGKNKSQHEEEPDIETARKMDFAHMVLNEMAKMPEYEELVMKALKKLRDGGII